MNNRSIRYLVMDVDGTLTDGKIYIGVEGELCKAFHVKDGCGICDILLPSGITPVIITGRTSVIVKNRCNELGITEIYQGIVNKLEKLKELCMGESNESDLSQVAYIGDDLNDLSCMNAIKAAGGRVGCPADAVKCIKDIADYVCEHKGGEGAVRDFIEWILAD